MINLLSLFKLNNYYHTNSQKIIIFINLIIIIMESVINNPA